MTLPAIASAYVRTRPVWSSVTCVPTRRAPAASESIEPSEDRPLDEVAQRAGEQRRSAGRRPSRRARRSRTCARARRARPRPAGRRPCGPSRRAQATTIPAIPTPTARRLASSSCVPLGSTSGSATGSRKSLSERPEPGDLNPAGDDRPDGQHADGQAHPEPRLAPLRLVEVLARKGRGLAAEDEEDHPERVEAGQERTRDADGEEHLPVPARRERRGEDRVLREEPRERRDPGQRERADQERAVRPRQEALEAAHLPHVLLAHERVDDEPGRKEQERLEERVRHQVEHRARVRAEACAEEHVADLRHRRVGDHALDVHLDECDQARRSAASPRRGRRRDPARAAPPRRSATCARAGRRRR